MLLSYLDANGDFHISMQEFVERLMYKGIDDKNVMELRNVYWDGNGLLGTGAGFGQSVSSRCVPVTSVS